MQNFTHLHVHTQFSLLDGAADIKKMMTKAKNDNMKAMAITDHGNMFGVFRFVAEANAAGIKPIVGCEFYVVDDRHQKQFSKEKKDKRYHQLFLAKNEIGYQNLCKLSSLGYKEGLYSKWPRIDKELIEKYHEGIIETTCCLGAEVPQAILNHGEEKAEDIFKWWLDLFGDDYYRHDGLDRDCPFYQGRNFAKPGYGICASGAQSGFSGCPHYFSAYFTQFTHASTGSCGFRNWWCHSG